MIALKSACDAKGFEAVLTSEFMMAKPEWEKTNGTDGPDSKLGYSQYSENFLSLQKAAFNYVVNWLLRLLN